MNEQNQNQVQVATKTAVVTGTPKQVSVLGAMASRLSIEPKKLMEVLKKTAFNTCRNDEEFISMCIVANKYGLDPITKEIYAFPNKKTGAVVPVVGYDGWVRMCNQNPAFDGMEFIEAEDGSWCECRIYRKDHAHPTAVREWFDECNMQTMPWQKFPRRMLRNKALNQCARLAFGLSGIYDPDEAERIALCQNLEAQSARVAKTIKTRPLGARKPTSAELMAKTAQNPAVENAQVIAETEYIREEEIADTGDYEENTASQNKSIDELIEAGVL